VQAAHGVRRSRTYLGERYRRLKKRRGSKRAALAIGHDILIIYCQMMKTGQGYQEKDFQTYGIIRVKKNERS
jgi:transposase